jgi:hypothetical protein
MFNDLERREFGCAANVSEPTAPADPSNQGAGQPGAASHAEPPALGAEDTRADPPVPIEGDSVSGSLSAPNTPERRRKRARETYRTDHLTKGYAAVEAGRTAREAREAAATAEREARIREMVAELRQDFAPEIQNKRATEMMLADFAGMRLVALDLRERYHRGELNSASELAEGTKLVNAMSAIYENMLNKWPRDPAAPAIRMVPSNVVEWLQSIHGNLFEDGPKPPQPKQDAPQPPKPAKQGDKLRAAT